MRLIGTGPVSERCSAVASKIIKEGSESQCVLPGERAQGNHIAPPQLLDTLPQVRRVEEGRVRPVPVRFRPPAQG